jgi:hypothetical protein
VKDGFGGAKSREGGLEEVEADECGEEEEGWMNEACEDEGGEDEGAREGADDVFGLHGAMGVGGW